MKDNPISRLHIDNILQKIGVLSSVKPLETKHQLFTVSWILRYYLKNGGDITKVIK